MPEEVLNEVTLAALRYAEVGLRVFPVRGKIPTIDDGFKAATLDRDIITLWYKNNPSWGVAIVIPKDVVIVDIDSPEAVQQLKSMDLDLPSTLTSKSKRGKHLWYRVPEGTEWRRRINLYPNVDLLVNGYVVAPPSKHPDGATYKWVEDFNLNSISDAPEWLLTCRNQASKELAKVEPDVMFEGIPEGQRNVALFRYCCWLLSKGRTKAEAKVLLREAAKVSGYNESNTDDMVTNVWKSYASKHEGDEANKKPKIWSLADLQKANLPPPHFVVEDMLAGIHLLIADEKIGKSALIQDVAISVAKGEKLWGHIKTNQCGVLYLDLEQDTYFSTKRWQNKMGDTQWPSNLYVSFDWPNFDEGGLDLIGEFLGEHPSVGWVIVDTLADMWPNDKGDTGNAYHKEQKSMRYFLDLHKSTGSAITLVHHTNKSNASRFVNRSSGSRAITGKASVIWGLEREENSGVGLLKITGKNVSEDEIELQYIRERQVWIPR